MIIRRHTVTRLRSADRVVRGDHFSDWTVPDELAISDCAFQPLSSAPELLGNREAGVTTLWLLIAPVGSDIGPQDRVSYRGETYEVDGGIRVWDSPTDRLPHIEVTLRRVTG